MTDQERIDVKDYIDARITPLDRDVKEIKRKIDDLFTKVDGVEASDDRSAGGDAMKKLIWRATAVIVSAFVGIGGLVVAAIALLA